ncbi:MAG: hypothetical protein JNK02_00425 [Planctomycetes bacterium]|nr:hypothetical protein [Planctomycetota bacterium]
MTSPASAGRAARVLALAAATLTLSACLARPPAECAGSRLGTVRAATRARAEDVARAVDHLAPLVERALPGAQLAALEVWVQDTPTLYVLRSSTYSDTDGFWAEGVRRIHLRDAADHLERTLAHELVHAGLASEWDALPGTLEEGVCDVVAARIVPEAAARLRAGRLATAAAALGGLPIEVDLWLDDPDGGPFARRGLQARLRVVAEDGLRVVPTDVFVVRAGLSTARAAPGLRRAYYGLGFLIAERIANRIGLCGLYALCVEARDEGRGEVPTARLLEAAGLEPSEASFHSALLAAFGAAEVREVLRLHPGLLLEPLADLLGAGIVDEPSKALPAVRGRVAIAGRPDAQVDLLDLTALRPRLEALADARAAAANPGLAGKEGALLASQRAP